MKLLNREQIRRADVYTIKNEPISSLNLMERASEEFVTLFLNLGFEYKRIHVFCGKGNNGGDGLAISRMLLQMKFKVKTYVIDYPGEASADFNINLERLKNIRQSDITVLNAQSVLPVIRANETVIDAMWGTGLTRPITGFATSVIHHINQSGARVFAVDMPSGTFCDTWNDDSAKIKARHTISFQCPKLAFFIPENESFVGEWHIADIGLNKNFIDSLKTNYHLLEKEDIMPLLKVREKFAHKGHFGHALLIAGSYGKAGAAILGAKACLRGGSGLVSVNTPGCGYIPVQTAVPEAMVVADKNYHALSEVQVLTPFSAIGIGPGIGMSPTTSDFFKELLSTCTHPMVIDADALNLIGQNPDLIKKVPKNSILTPHPGEFTRLCGSSRNHFERIDKALAFSAHNHIILILKGAYSAIFTPAGQVFFNSTGNPGMATGGSGDVLTGLLTALLAQQYNPEDAAIIGTFIHGLSGDLACAEKGEISMTAGDIINFIPEAFCSLQKHKH